MTVSPSSGIVLLFGAGGIGLAVARRVAAGRTLVVADLSLEAADREAEVLRTAGFTVQTVRCDLGDPPSVRAAVAFVAGLGPVTHLICAAGVSPSQAPIETILDVDLVGTAVVLEEVGRVIAEGGAGVVISSQSGHRLPALTPEQDEALATTPPEELRGLDFLQPEALGTTLLAYQHAKRGNSLRVAGEATAWGRRGARINAVSPGIVMTPLAADELNGPRGEGYRSMLASMPVPRAAAPDEIGDLCAFLLGPQAAFITGTDVLADGGSTASYRFGELRRLQEGWAQS